MKSRWHLAARILALSLVTVPVQRGSAVPSPGVAAAVGVSLTHTGQASVTSRVPAVDAAEARVTDALSQASLVPGSAQRPPVPGDWALLIAGVLGIGAIARRRSSSIGDRYLAPYRFRRR